ncbi:hypothetical protein KAW64_09925, partial [bacterium]|nr:hypothetical protein [bacterium]
MRKIASHLTVASGEVARILAAAPRGSVRILTAVVVCLLVSAVVAAQPAAPVEAAGSEAVEDSGFVGYRIDGEEVVFTFDRTQYEFAARGDNGQYVAMAGIPLGELAGVAVAGEFNGWSTDAWMMELVEAGVYELRRPLERFGEYRSWAFKFVIDGMLWAEPSSSTPNIVPTGLGFNNFNLLLVLAEPAAGELPVSGRKPTPGGHVTPGAPASPGSRTRMPELVHVDSPLLERLTLIGSQLPEGCALMPLDHMIGAAPIPVDSNPMITSDRRVIGFVSLFVMPPTPEEEAAWEAEMSMMGPDAERKRFEELIAERTSTVRAAYVAIYESLEHGAETGVFALEFAEP